MSDDIFAIPTPSARRVKEVRHLPSGFDGYKHVPATQAEKRSVAYRKNQRGTALYYRWKKTKNPLLLDLALGAFTSAAKADPDTCFPALKAASLSNVARVLRAMDDTSGAMQQMRDAIAISERHGIPILIYALWVITQETSSKVMPSVSIFFLVLAAGIAFG